MFYDYLVIPNGWVITEKVNGSDKYNVTTFLEWTILVQWSTFYELDNLWMEKKMF